MTTDRPDDRADVIEQAAEVLNVELVRQTHAGEIEMDATYECERDLARALSDAGLLVSPDDQYKHWADAVAKVTPCACSAQRARAERAEAERDLLRAQVAAVRSLAEGWHQRGSHDMEFSKQLPEDVRDAIYEAGAEMVESSRHVRAALDTAGGGDDGK